MRTCSRYKNIYVMFNPKQDAPVESISTCVTMWQVSCVLPRMSLPTPRDRISCIGNMIKGANSGHDGRKRHAKRQELPLLVAPRMTWLATRKARVRVNIPDTLPQGTVKPSAATHQKFLDSSVMDSVCLADYEPVCMAGLEYTAVENPFPSITWLQGSYLDRQPPFSGFGLFRVNLNVDSE